MKNQRLIVFVVIGFLLGVLACHIFYYSTSYFTEKKIHKEIEALKRDHNNTQQAIERIDSLLNELE